jgi:hypothetical protein
VLAKKLSLTIKLLIHLLATAVNSSYIVIYSITITKLSLTNIREHTENYAILFIITNLRQYKIFLELL